MGQVIAIYDGWNSMLVPRDDFGMRGAEYRWRDVDPAKLAYAMARRAGHELAFTRFVFRIPTIENDELQHRYLKARIATMERDGVRVDYDYLRERPGHIPGSITMKEVSVDVDVGCRALTDLVQSAADNRPLSGVIMFTADRDLQNVGTFLRGQAKNLERMGRMRGPFEVYSAVPEGRSGIIRGAVDIQYSREMYERYLDPRDYITPIRSEMQRAHEQELQEIRAVTERRLGETDARPPQEVDAKGKLAGSFVEIMTRYCTFELEHDARRAYVVLERRSLGFKPAAGRAMTIERAENTWIERPAQQLSREEPARGR